MGRALQNAHVLPMHTPGAGAEAIAWDGDTILAVGDERSVRQVADEHGIEPEDAGGRIVLPGFVDAHMHFLHVGLRRTRPDLRFATSREHALEILSDWLEAHPGDDPVTGEGWDESSWAAEERPTRADVDRVAGDRPVVLRRICGHVAVANSAALPAIRVRWDDERVDAKSGLLLEEPSLYLNEVLPASDDVLDDAVQEACRVAHRLGVTALGAYEQAPLRAALLRAARRGGLPVRIACSVYVQQLAEAIGEGFRTCRPAPGPDGPSPWLRDGGVKVFLDGSLGGHTALMLDPYDDRPETRGRAIWDQDEVAGIFRSAHESGIQIHAHAIGDGAIEMGLDAFAGIIGREGGPAETGLSPTDAAPLRHRFEHFEIVHDHQVERAAALGVTASSQPNFVGAWSSKGGMYEERIGKRFWLNNRFRSFQRMGLRVCFGSDGMPFGPLHGLQSAVQHPVPEERLSIREALHRYTWQAAWAMHWEEEIGSLEAGKKADLVILDRADLDDAPQEWTIEETVAAGETVARNDKPVPYDE